MRIVKKFNKGDSVVELRRLGEDEVEALYYAFLKNKGTLLQKNIACTVAEYMRDHGGWLECDCDPHTLPLLTTGLSIKSNYYLQRINSRGKHLDGCQFKGIDYQYQKSAGETLPCRKNKPLNLHVRGSIKSKQSAGEAKLPKKSTATKVPRLARVLYSLIVEAKLNRVDLLNKQSSNDCYQALCDAAQSYRLARGVALSNHFSTYPYVDRMVNGLKAAEHKWPKGSRPYALCVCIAERVIEKTLFFRIEGKTVDITLEGELKKSSGRISIDSGPYLVIFTVTDTNDEREIYRPFNGYYVPVYSDEQFVPVDSNYERRVLGLMTHRAKWWVNINNLKAEIIKPLFDIKEFHDGELKSCKPDFLIETPNSRIIFEVMGSKEDSYIARKKQVVAQMESIGEVIEFDAIGADQSGNWDSELRRRISMHTAKVFAGNKAEGQRGGISVIRKNLKSPIESKSYD